MLRRASLLTALAATLLACGGDSASKDVKEPSADSDRPKKSKDKGDDEDKKREQELADEDEREARKRRMRMREREEQEENVATNDEEPSEPAEPEAEPEPEPDEKTAEAIRVRKKAAAEEARERKKQAAFEAREKKKAAEAKKKKKAREEDIEEDDEEEVAEETPKRSPFKKKAKKVEEPTEEEDEDEEEVREKPAKKLTAAQKKKAVEEERRAKKKAEAEAKAAKKKAAEEERLAKKKADAEEKAAKKKADDEKKKKVVAEEDEPEEEEAEEEEEEEAPTSKPAKKVVAEEESDKREDTVDEEEIEVDTASLGPPDPTAESDELDLSSTPTRVEEVAPPPPPTLAIDRRPLTIGKSKLEFHGGLRSVTVPTGMTTSSSQGLALGATYGFAAKGEVGIDYTLGVNPGSAKGPLQLRGTYLATHSEKLDIAISLGFMLDFVDSVDPGTMMTTTRTAKGLLVGVWARYHLGAKLSAFSGLPATPSSTGSLSATGALPPIGHQLAVGLGGQDPIGLDLPAGLGYQATPKLYTFLSLNLVHLGMSKSESAVLFSDFIPIALGGFYAMNKMDIGAIIADDLKQGTDFLRFDLVVRYSIK